MYIYKFALVCKKHPNPSKSKIKQHVVPLVFGWMTDYLKTLCANGLIISLLHASHENDYEGLKEKTLAYNSTTLQ